MYETKIPCISTSTLLISNGFGGLEKRLLKKMNAVLKTQIRENIKIKVNIGNIKLIIFTFFCMI